MEQSNKKYFNIWVTITIIILAMFAMFLVYPLVMILYKSVIDPDSGGFTMKYFAKFFGQKYYWGSLVNSLKVTLWATFFCVLIGTPLAYVMRSVKIFGKNFLEILIIISFLSPPFIGAYSWIILLGRNGVVTKFFEGIGIKLGGIYGFKGILVVFMFQMFPLIYIYISGALKNLDNSLNEAAESLGCTGAKRVIQIIVPLVMPTLLASSLLVFMRVLADFGTPMLIGEGYKTMPVLIYNEFINEVGGEDGFAAAMSIIIIIATTAIFLIQKYAANRNSFSMTALRPMEAKRIKGFKNFFAHLFVYLVVFIAILPQAVVIYTSFMKTKGGQVFTSGFSLDSYKATIMAKDNSAIWNTYLFGIAAILIIIVVGILIAYVTTRKSNVLTNILDTISMFPYIIPGSVLGIALLFGFGKKPLLLSGTAIIMIISFAIRRMAYTIRSSAAIISQISPSVEEASLSLGASEIKTFLFITIPMMLPGVLSGAVMSWMTAISELSSSIILYTNKTKTLTVAIYTEVVRGNYGNAAAYSTVLTLTSIISLLIFFKVSGKHEVDL